MKRCVLRTFQLKLRLEENPGAPPLLGLAQAWNRESDLAVAIGPEGGWTDQERVAMDSLGWLPASLGTTVLRAETAAIAAAAVLNQPPIERKRYQRERNPSIVPDG